MVGVGLVEAGLDRRIIGRAGDHAILVRLQAQHVEGRHAAHAMMAHHAARAGAASIILHAVLHAAHGGHIGHVLFHRVMAGLGMGQKFGAADHAIMVGVHGIEALEFCRLAVGLVELAVLVDIELGPDRIGMGLGLRPGQRAIPPGVRAF